MSIWVVVGGQFGSEGKGKVSVHLARLHNIDVSVRCGGPNSGHSVLGPDGRVTVFRQIPAGAVAGSQRLLIAPGGLVDLSVLKQELRALRLENERVGVDRNCFVIEAEDRKVEADSGLSTRIGSTLSGVGAAISRRVLRGPSARTAGAAAADHPWLGRLITDVAGELNAAADAGKGILIEGTQGFGLSLYHSASYPQCTSRDTTASAFLSECGLSPALDIKIVLVMRTFPIRVAGNSGPLETEVSWETVRRESGAASSIAELTSVTGNVRRVGRFEWDLARRAALANRPHALFLNGLDYIHAGDRDALTWERLSIDSRRFALAVATTCAAPLEAVGASPSPDALISVPIGKERVA